MRILVTGAAGFIGMHTCKALLDRGDEVIGIDNLNDYYEVQLKRSRLNLIEGYEKFRFIELDLVAREAIMSLFQQYRFDRVFNAAAQAGVRYSIENPHAYIDSNLVGFANILEACRHTKVGHLVYASSSSVYGANENLPFSVKHNVDHPVSLYAATKKAGELMAHAYSHLYGLPTSGLRFFTVYGPWGRPDMAPSLFTRAILEGKPINVFNEGRLQRDFTYIDDIVEGVVRIIDKIAEPDPDFNSREPSPAVSTAPYRIYNIGNNEPVNLLDFIHAIEVALGKTAVKNLVSMQPGDVVATAADIEELYEAVGFRPSTPLSLGVQNFVDWYRDYHGFAPSAG
jgi:UDP-glucuronate 4-epimerase